MEFKVGQILFINNDNPYSKIVRLFNKKVYGTEGFGHCGIITEAGFKFLVHEAVSKGFVSTYYDKEFLENKIKNGDYSLRETKIKLTNVRINADKYLGKPYGWLDIIGIYMFYFYNFKFIRLTGAKNLICSEAVARILFDSSNKKINFEEEYDKRYDLITPMDIFLSKYLK